MHLLIFMYMPFNKSAQECIRKVTAAKEIKHVSFEKEALNLGLVAIRV